MRVEKSYLDNFELVIAYFVTAHCSFNVLDSKLPISTMFYIVSNQLKLINNSVAIKFLIFVSVNLHSGHLRQYILI